MKLAAFYHLWSEGAWTLPVAEHWQALRDSEYEAPVFVGVVGDPDSRLEARATLADIAPPATVVVEALEGHEQVTLDALHTYASMNDGAVLYAHTKGASDNTEFRAKWRRTMSQRVVENWRENLKLLEDHDAVGCFWLTPEDWPSMVDSPFFGGNYWMARCAYIRTLSKPSRESRFDAERWIGTGNPKVVDLNPPAGRGWPAEHLFVP